MSDQSTIEWTDATWNPVRGCTKISPGCRNCYAETFAERFRGVKGHPYEQGFDLRLVPEKLNAPLGWKKPKRIFVNSMSDLFHEGVPFEYISKVLDTMVKTPHHTFQVLTKRPERMLAYLRWFNEGTTPNVWWGTSVEDRKHGLPRIELLKRSGIRNTFLSCEPLLEDLDADFTGIGWVIVGGESGPGARPCNIEWIRRIVRKTKGLGIPCFVKQLGSKPTFYDDGDGAGGPIYEFRVGPPDYNSVHNRKGGDPSEWPDDLRVREFPT